ncbi:hypothetical protein HQ520_14650 [bacterium]|nr:hypothetical protein [bacterium]
MLQRICKGAICGGGRIVAELSRVALVVLVWSVLVPAFPQNAGSVDQSAQDVVSRQAKPPVLSTRPASTRERVSRSRRDAPNAVTTAPTLQRATRQASRSSSAPHDRGDADPPDLRYPTDVVKGSLHFRPMDGQVKPGGTFTTDLVLTNRTRRPADGFEISIAYDPQWLTFKGYEALGIADYVDTGSIVLVREARKLVFSAKFSRPLAFEQVSLLKLIFDAADARGFTWLQFVLPPEGVTRVYSGETNLLGREDQGLAGVVDSYVLVNEATRNQFLAYEEDDETSDSQAIVLAGLAEAASHDFGTTDPSVPVVQGHPIWSRVPPDARPGASASIEFQAPESRQVEVGEEFWIDLILQNDSLIPIDLIGLRIEYDAHVLEVIDEDANNWILRGTNIWDGAFHQAYPFDFHRVNDANNSRGEIDYVLGRQYGVWSFPTGIFARMRFRAIGAADVTAIRLVRGKEGTRPKTYVRSYGIDRLPDAWVEKPPQVAMRVGGGAIAEADESATLKEALLGLAGRGGPKR